MRKAKVFYQDYLAGTLTETNDGEYIFKYDNNYVREHPQDFLTFSMPVRTEPFIENRLFQFWALLPKWKEKKSKKDKKKELNLPNFVGFTKEEQTDQKKTLENSFLNPKWQKLLSI